MRSGDRPGLQNRRAAGNPVTGGFDPHSLPPFFLRTRYATPFHERHAIRGSHALAPPAAPPASFDLKNRSTGAFFCMIVCIVFGYSPRHSDGTSFTSDPELRKCKAHAGARRVRV